MATMTLRLAATALLAMACAACATTYYVDNSAAGNDGVDGTSASTPWRTLAKVNSSTFGAGDRVLFKRGGVWAGQLAIASAGGSGNVLYFGPYGDAAAAAPTIDCGAAAKAAVFVKNNANNVTVEGFCVTNYDGADVFDGAEARRSGIQVGEWGGSVSSVLVIGNEVLFVEGLSNSNHAEGGSPRGTTLDKANDNQYNNAAIYANASDMAGLTIDRNYIHDCTNTGILVFAYNRVTGLLIQNNAISNVGSDGIEILNATSPLVQYNSCVGAGNNSGNAERGPGVLGYHGVAVCGMWAYGSSSPVFQFNYCEGTRRIIYDGQAWDFDIAVTGTAVYQYNYSRSNEGGFLLSSSDAGVNRICRYNISVNDGGRQVDYQGFFTGTAVYYNNEFYRSDGQRFEIGGCGGTFTNNVFYTNGSSTIPYQSASRTFANNAFYGHTPVNPGAGAVTADPQLVNATGSSAIPAGRIFTIDEFRTAVAGFQLQNGSPLRNAGQTIANNGGKDFWGNTLYSGAADIGAHEYQTVAPVLQMQRRNSSPGVGMPHICAAGGHRGLGMCVTGTAGSNAATLDFLGRALPARHREGF